MHEHGFFQTEKLQRMRSLHMQYVLEDSDEVVAIHIHSWKLDVINMIAGNSVTASNNHFTATAGLLSIIA